MAPTGIPLAFALATAVFANVPGPARLCTAAQTLARGRRAGLLAALDISVGGHAHVSVGGHAHVAAAARWGRRVGGTVLVGPGVRLAADRA